MTKICKECSRSYKPKRSGGNRGYACNSCVVKKYRRRVKDKALAYKGGKCMHCGYDKCKGALEFHHRDPNKKDFGLSTRDLTRAWSKIQIELDKCDLVCANCHREIHEDNKL